MRERTRMQRWTQNAGRRGKKLGLVRDYTITHTQGITLDYGRRINKNKAKIKLKESREIEDRKDQSKS